MLSLKHVYKTYQESSHVLRDLTCNFEAGQMHVICGSSGAGKTTLFKLLSTQIKPTSGEIFFNNKNIYSFNEKEYLDFRKKNGIIFQDYKLIDEWSIKKNIILPLEILGESKAQIELKIETISKQLKIDDILNEYPSWVSGGQQQRAAIARALITNPQIVFADEPTAHLDRELKQVVLDLLYKKTTEGALVIISTHDENIIYASDVRKHLLSKGQFEI